MNSETIRPEADNITVIHHSYETPNIARTLTGARLVGILEQAEGGDTRDLFALYRDTVIGDNHVQTEFVKRKGAILCDQITAIPFDPENPEDVRTAELCRSLVAETFFFQAVSHMLNSALWPISVMEKIYRPTAAGFMLADLVPVPFQLLDFAHRDLRIYDVDPDGVPLPTSHYAAPDRYIVHRGNILPVPDCYGGPMRSVLFWWLMRSMSRQWWGELLERYGIPFLLGKYTDDAGRRVLERAFQQARKLGGLVVSRGSDVDSIAASSQDNSEQHKTYLETCNAEITRLILGQTLSTVPTGTGMGSGVADLQGEVRDDLRKLDGKLLAATIRESIFLPLCRANNLPGNPPAILFGSDSVADVKATVATLSGLSSAGLEPDDDALPKIAARIGYGVRRKAQPAAGALPVSFSASLPDPRDLSADLARAFRGSLAPLASIIRTSDSPSVCRQRVEQWALAHDPTAAAEIIAESMAAYAAKGAAGSNP